MGHKIVFFQTASGAPFDQKRLCLIYFARAFGSDLEYNLSDRPISVGYFRFIYRTNYGLNKLKKHGSQNK